jgi:DNA-binding MarR family transcriptional regulator
MYARGLGTRLRHLLDLLDGDVSSVYRENGLPGYRPRYTPVVRALLEQCPASITAIAAHSGLTHSAVSQTVQEMRKRKLVTVAKGKDARERKITLAPACERLVPVLEAQWDATNHAAKLLDQELTAPLSMIIDEAIAALQRRPFRERIRSHLPAPVGRRADLSRVGSERTSSVGNGDV